MRVSVYSIQNTLFEGEAEKLIARTPEGQMTVLDDHLPIVAVLNGPLIRVVDKDGKERHLDIVSGILEVRPQSDVVVIANVAE